ncbi:hypothetical protein E0E62_11915 [Streptomyces sp. 16-176A]
MPSLVRAGFAGRSRRPRGAVGRPVMPPSVTNMFVTNKFVVNVFVQRRGLPPRPDGYRRTPRTHLTTLEP